MARNIMSELQHCNIDTDLLIQEVKARPCLYTPDAAKYSDANYKKELWEDVASKVFASEWPKLNKEQKAKKAELAHRRWRNVRACFSRELKRQKDPKWVFGIAYKRRKYLYYNELLFLKPELEKLEAYEEEETQGIDLSHDKSNDADTQVTIDTNIEETPIPEAVPLKSLPKIATKTKKTEMTSLTPTSTLPAIRPQSNIIKTHDADSTNFALSLVPILNLLPLNKRIDAQISILSVLKRFHVTDKVAIQDGGPRYRKTFSRKKKAVDQPILIKSEEDSDE